VYEALSYCVYEALSYCVYEALSYCVYEALSYCVYEALSCYLLRDAASTAACTLSTPSSAALRHARSASSRTSACMRP
jgi:hypothetical protein